ncbi:prolyl 3-hydroxylase 2-like [Trichogramma pretiosum]|uniref:prolyl 3-hydroxylase 2-like n=1 Tax=Trichogramma pretiosum TaxID=7493 RepID=UPI0006C9B4C2|nr:prolyl 3-hydroxylase 2-like [Trichogramma pretiosum]
MHSILRWYLLLALCSGVVRSVIEPEEDNEIPRESASPLKNASSAATEVGKNVRVDWNKSIVETYETAVQAYLDEDWKGCVRGFDELAAKYRQLKSTLIDCRRQCRNELEQSFKPIWPENIEDLHFYERKIQEALCVLNCHQDYRELPGHKQALRRVPQKFEWKLVGGEYFAYLHVCYYQLDMLQEAANAAYSYLVWHADHQPSRAALAWYMQMPEVDNTTIRNLLAEDFVADYVAGVKAYESGYYEEAVVRLEAAVASYLEGEEQCRYYCEGSFEQSWNPDFVTSVSNHFVFDLNCKRRCSRLLNTIDGEYRDALLVQFFNYLQFAYYKLNEIGSACEAVATFLLFFPADETMLSNKAYYESLPTVRPEHFEPREELRKYFLRQEYEMRLLLLVEEKFSPIEERLIKLDKTQNQ